MKITDGVNTVEIVSIMKCDYKECSQYNEKSESNCDRFDNIDSCHGSFAIEKFKAQGGKYDKTVMHPDIKKELDAISERIKKRSMIKNDI